MSTEKVNAVEINGFMPSVDPTQTEKLFVLNGENYLLDSIGPRSVFGNRKLLPFGRAKAEYIQGFRINIDGVSRSFLLDGDGLWEWIEASGAWHYLFSTPDMSTIPYRMTSGYLEGILYICHPRIGIICFNIFTGDIRPHRVIGTATPENAIAVRVNNGRLCVLTDSQFAWSAPSDGLDFTPNLGQGGFQILSAFLSGDPIMLTSYAGGCLSWTTSGVLRSEFTGDVEVWRHRILATAYRPMNSFCVVGIEDDSTLILDERGLFTTSGGAPTPYAPLFNEFLLDYIHANQFAATNRMRLEYDIAQKRLYLSVCPAYVNPKFTRAFVYYPPLDKWGSFDEEHYGIVPVDIQTGSRKGSYFGFVDNRACVRVWNRIPNREQAFQSANFLNANLYYPAVQKGSHVKATELGTVASSCCKLTGFSKIGARKIAGYFLPGVGAPIGAFVTDLGARIQIGLYRPTGQNAVDEVSEIQGVLLRSNTTQAVGTTQVDWQLQAGIEDWQTEVGTEDWNNPVDLVQCRLRIHSTLDGVNTFLTTEPQVVENQQNAAYYACSITGVWHILELQTVNPGDSFHVKTLEITAASAGRFL